jgi:hypothetical protein
MPIVAWYMLSNESYMNRVIRDVFPTVDAISDAFPIVRSMDMLRTTLLAQEYQSISQLADGRRAKISAASAYLNFFNGLLYDPPACAILSVFLWRSRGAEWRGRAY